MQQDVVALEEHTGKLAACVTHRVLAAVPGTPRHQLGLVVERHLLDKSIDVCLRIARTKGNSRQRGVLLGCFLSSDGRPAWPQLCVQLCLECIVLCWLRFYGCLTVARQVRDAAVVVAVDDARRSGSCSRASSTILETSTRLPAPRQGSANACS